MSDWVQISIFDLIQGNNKPTRELLASGRYYYRCIKCHGIVGLKDKKTNEFYYKPDVCGKCLEVIDWSDEDGV